jgi:hypothetical protein
MNATVTCLNAIPHATGVVWRSVVRSRHPVHRLVSPARSSALFLHPRAAVESARCAIIEWDAAPDRNTEAGRRSAGSKGCGGGTFTTTGD